MKRSRLVLRSEADRSATRDRVAIAATCRIGDRPEQDVQVADLSHAGCRLIGRAVGVTKGEPLDLSLGPQGPIPGKLKWVKRGSLGVAFDAPLGEVELNELRALEQPADVVPIRRPPIAPV